MPSAVCIAAVGSVVHASFLVIRSSSWTGVASVAASTVFNCERAFSKRSSVEGINTCHFLEPSFLRLPSTICVGFSLKAISIFLAVIIEFFIDRFTASCSTLGAPFKITSMSLEYANMAAFSLLLLPLKASHDSKHFPASCFCSSSSKSFRNRRRACPYFWSIEARSSDAESNRTCRRATFSTGATRDASRRSYRTGAENENRFFLSILNNKKINSGPGEINFDRNNGCPKSGPDFTVSFQRDHQFDFVSNHECTDI